MTVDEKLDAILEEIRQLKDRFAGWDVCRCTGGRSATKNATGVHICDQCGKSAEWADCFTKLAAQPEPGK